MAKKGERYNCPIEGLLGWSDAITTCPKCASRLDIVEVIDENNTIERCLNCGQLYEVSIDEELENEVNKEAY